ncbi:MAG TPA: alpha/beta fold hydrolase [Ramlibacter sp.]|nr:alpha/beta fold hydrolase [Ramlibacter sp.]
MSGRPLILGTPDGDCLGWFHAARGPRRDVAVVMCRPLGYEALCSYRTYTQLAQALSATGFDVLRFDYHGAGDSCGNDTDPDRVGAWLRSIAVAIDEARRISGATQVALFGMRLGATLAMESALRRGGVASLMLWAPCPSGRAFAREMRAAFASQRHEGLQTEGGVEALGTFFTSETLVALDGLAPDRADVAPAPRILVIARDDLPGEGPLPARLAKLGAEVTSTVWPGYADMMAEPHDAKLTPDTLDSITQWLCSVHPVQDVQPVHDSLPWPAAWRMGNVVESAISFGPARELFGVMSQPSMPPRSAKSDSAVVLLNVGGNYRVGPNRVYVKVARDLAAAGYRVLRMDVGGVGDSRIEDGFSPDQMYRDYATTDVSAAIDMLVERGCSRVFLLGICSGAYLAFQTALKDPRVSGQMIINARLLEWDTEKNGPWQASMQQYYKSTRYYKQALLRTDVYRRVLRGEVNVRGIALRLLDLARARLRRIADRVLGRAPQEGVLAKMKHLASRGVDTLVAMSEQDDGLDYVEFHLGSGGARMRGHSNFRMVLVEHADHTFSTVASQRALLHVLREHLDEIHEPSKAEPSVIAQPVATT